MRAVRVSLSLQLQLVRTGQDGVVAGGVGASMGCPMCTGTCCDHSMSFAPLLPIFFFFLQRPTLLEKKKEKEEGKKGKKRFSGQEQAQGDGARGSVDAAFGPLFICSRIAFVKERRSRQPCHLSPRLLSFHANQRR